MLALKTSNNPNVLGLNWQGMNGLGGCNNCGMGQISTSQIILGVVAVIFLWPFVTSSKFGRML